MTEQAKHAVCRFGRNGNYEDNDVYFIESENLIEESFNGVVGYIGQGYLSGGRSVQFGEGKIFGENESGTINGQFTGRGLLDGYIRIFSRNNIQYANFFYNANKDPNASAKSIPHRFTLDYDLKSPARFTLYDPTCKNAVDRFTVTQSGMNILKNYKFYFDISVHSANKHRDFFKSSFYDSYTAGEFNGGKAEWAVKKDSDSCYIGEFFIDSPCGWGKTTYKNGIYVGERYWNKKQGFGIYRWNSGTEYAGTWQENCMSGFGVCFYSNGDYYAGEWKNDKREGYGTYVWSDGSRRSGTYADDKFVG